MKHIYQIIETLAHEIDNAAHASGSGYLARLANCLEILRDGLELHRIAREYPTTDTTDATRGAHLCIQHAKACSLGVSVIVDALVDGITGSLPRADMAALTQCREIVDDLATATRARYLAVKERSEGVIAYAMAYETTSEIAIARAIERSEKPTVSPLQGWESVTA